jgi:hypothetical protein
VFIQSPRPAAAAEAAGAPQENIFPVVVEAAALALQTKNACTHRAPLWVGWEAARGAFSVGHLWIRCWAAARTHVHLVCVCIKNEFKFNLLLFKLFAGCCWENTSALPHTAGWLRLKVKYFYTLTGGRLFYYLCEWAYFFNQGRIWMRITLH